MSLLTAASFQVFAATDTAAALLSGDAQIASLTVGSITEGIETVNAIGLADSVLVPVGTGEDVAIDGYWAGDLAALTDATDSMLVVIETTTGSTLMVPGGPPDSAAGQMPVTLSPGALVRIRVEWAQAESSETDFGTVQWYGTATEMKAANTVTKPDGGAVWALLTTAGTVGGDSLSVGLHKTTKSGSIATSAGAKGWLIAAEPAKTGA